MTEKLIEVSKNPFLMELKDFGGAEAVAGITNVAATGLVHLLTANPMALTLAGPVLEKAGFFGWEAIKAIGQENYLTALKQSIRNGMGNLAADICVHDPMYVALMAYGVSNDVAAPEVLSLLSFLAALPAAAGMKYVVGEGLHFLGKKRSGFEWEKFYESRFLCEDDPERVIDGLSRHFVLDNADEREYKDQYRTCRMPSFSGRLPRVRERTIEERTNLELIYTLNKRESPEDSEWNYFVTRKEKGRMPIDRKHGWYIRRQIGEPTTRVKFNRESVYGDELRACMDTVLLGGEEKHVLELKVYRDTKMLCEAIQMLRMDGYKVRATTQPKDALIGILNDL